MDTQHKQPLDLEAIRARLTSADAPQFWRGLNELAETEEFRQYIEDEFPNRADLMHQMDRRQFLILAGASLALAGMSGCRFMPQEKAVPQVKSPEEYIPGKPLYYATAAPFGGFGRGVLVESHEGRPTKIEGNDQHPSSLGATDAFMQASILTLYDPDRSKNVKQENDIRTWESFLDAVKPELAKQEAKGGAGLRILTEATTSPTFAAQMERLRQKFPLMTWHQYQTFNQDSIREGAKQAFGEIVQTVYDFSKATRVVALDSDFLSDMPGSVRYARDFAQARRVREDKKEMNRLYAIESTPTLVGSMADHHRAVRAAEIVHVAAALASRLGVNVGLSDISVPKGVTADFLDAVVKDLQANRGTSIVIAGEQQPAAVHALAHSMNAALGNVGATVLYTEPVEVTSTNHLTSLTELTTAMQEGKVELLLMLDVNPVYTAPADLKFAQHLIKVPLRVHQGLYEDETSALCQWHVPDTHYLEAWGDIRAHDGTASIIQPLIKPLYEGKSGIELLAQLTGDQRSGYEIVRSYWSRPDSGAGSKQAWDSALNKGLVEGTQAKPKSPTLTANLSVTLPEAAPESDIEIIFRPDPTIWDGRHANNGWLQELPKPLSKLTWDNAVLIGPRTAQRFGVNNEDLIVITYRQKEGGAPMTLEAPVMLSFGHADDSITVHLGYGRTRAGQVGTGIGFNFGLLRTSDAPDFGAGAKLTKGGGQFPLAYTEHHHLPDWKTAKIDSQDERPLILVGDIEEFRKNSKLRFGHGGGHAAAPTPATGEHAGEAAHGASGAEHGTAEGEHPKETSLYPDTVGGDDDVLLQRPDHSFDYKDPDFNQWAMVIDLNTCIGCNACTIACQAENNIPTVGKSQVKRGREMHWIRIDRYYSGNMDNPRTYFQPMPCMHCEYAPCEPVCPVAATVHSHDGLNQMVYNRCIGTKYCSNNCPYKVRRFNFLNYANDFTYPVLMLQKNPDVTVRSRGVMEKCTFCTQRISEARIEAKKANRKLGGDEVVTACQQVCPTQSIIFGDKNQPDSQVAKLKEQGHNYILLEDLQTRPRTTYLARIRNLNPEIREES
jgi:MoCo/4Fe-4S cofactor protein with predicted Tat translocation signal